MIRLFLFLLKTTFFSVIVLVLGNVVFWKGETISNHIENHLEQTEKGDLIRKFKRWSDRVIDHFEASNSETSTSQDQKIRKISHRKTQQRGDSVTTSQSDHELISQTERQKLKSLIQKINND